MTNSPADDETIEATAFSTSLDPYGQLVRVLMPRASYIAIFDRLSTPLWLSDGYDGFDLLHLVEESLHAAGAERATVDEENRHGFSRSWDGDTAYVFVLRDGANLLGALAVSCQDGSNGARSTAFVHGLLRPALQVLARELAHQQSVGDLRKNLTSRDGDLAMLLEASGAAHEKDTDDLEQLLQNCVANLDCALGALLIPDRKIALSAASEGALRGTDAEILAKTQKHLLTWVQVQRRTLVLNKVPPNNPLGALPYKILACPIRHGVQDVGGVLILFKRVGPAEFDARQVRIVELLSRRIAYVVQSAYDPATGLLTRSAFEQRVLAQLAAANAEAQHCVVYADVDRLHVVNENHGMHVGDEVIVAIAATIRANLGANVSASRISGDRFALLFLDTHSDDAVPLVERLRDAVRDLDFNRDGKRLPLSISFGLAAVPNTRYPLSHALAAAEVACKAAKDRGRSRVEVYRDASRRSVPRDEDVAILGTLREAIAHDRFRMDAQPIVTIGDVGQPRRFELLLRMIDGAGERVTPDKFLSAAERYQLTTDIDRWVVQYALEVISSAAPALLRLDAHFAINISGQSLGDEDFIGFLQQRLREYALPPQLLSFEITETATVANIVRAEQLIRRLRELGHAIALDDFGKGLSSLTYLKSLPVSHLKIDGGLVRDVVGNPQAQAMVTAIVQLARTMNLKTTAECIESEAIQTAVGALGVDFGQGFVIGRPRPVEQVLQDLLRGSAGVVRASAPLATARPHRLVS
ncbi:bifunctional diguanylate cyclase/phosphodiesterase [Peristeroidobacter soli]|uniref:bifunctional diguanylate cyclase/phosphodiesterase n=1 Tax=Peristeroidobacter soli TaxID=2497877 RepID=UPI00158EB4CB|nr:bifunctional diguanylate cyclase/phosphodiesterase [Peristeroidobacter soli]